MFDEGSGSSAATTLVDRICAASRTENRAAGQRLEAIGELHLLRVRESGGCEHFATDTWEAVSAEVAAALRISPALASSYVGYAQIMRNELPKVGALLVAGEISYGLFQTIAHRTGLISDPEVMAGVDAELAVRVARWPSMTRGRLAGYIDRVVGRADRDAVRRRREKQAGREFSIWDGGNGVSEVFGRLLSTDAHAVDARLDALADTVCGHDPRTRQQRRADALGALAAGAQRLACGCGRTDCAAGTTPAPAPVVIHVIADQASLAGDSAAAPGSLIGADGLIPAELVAELARSAKLRPLSAPVDAEPEPGYAPSRALADFVRCRDLTCRFPGCDRPATDSDVDHTIAYRDGGPTHASNLKTLCRLHHLIKTFWGWHDQQLPDATLIWTSPAGQTYITTPGSALLFPALCAPTGELAPPPPKRADRCPDRSLMMPKRRHTRAQNHARYIADQRRQNRETRVAQHQTREDDEPPPF
jgi:hypothetical protein